MQMDKSATILEAQWLEQEIPRIQEELETLQNKERELLTTPLETVSRAYTDAYRAERKRAYLFYHRRRSVTPTAHGYKERNHEVGWLAALDRALIAAVVIRAVYTVYRYHRLEETTRGLIWGAAILVAAIGLAFLPALVDLGWERYARHKAAQAAEQARISDEFRREKEERQAQLDRCRARIAELKERLRSAQSRYDTLRRKLTVGDLQA